MTDPPRPPAAELAPLASLAFLGVRIGMPFSVEALARFGELATLLGTDPLAPTALHEPRRIVDDHLADALVAIALPEVQAAHVIADLGAGAGIPGLPLAIALPRAQLHLVESNGRKCAFIERAIDQLGLANAEVVNERAETWQAGLARCDLVTARALASLDVVAEYAAPLLRIGGALVAWRGQREPEVERDAARAADVLGLSVHDPVHVHPYPAAQHRFLHVMVKVAATPGTFPRRPGMALKRPLGRRTAPPSDRRRR